MHASAHLPQGGGGPLMLESRGEMTYDPVFLGFHLMGTGGDYEKKTEQQHEDVLT